jgi:uridine phosphorylase
MKNKYPILEFDNDRSALVEPSKIIKKNQKMPNHCVLCFFQDVISNLHEEKKITEITHLGSEIGRNPIYNINGNEPAMALLHPGVGAPLAACFLEEVIALGGTKFIVCGGAGILDSSHKLGELIVPISAIRDEGTSYHYMSPSREVAPTTHALEAIKTTLLRADIPFKLTKTWTTDALYRETIEKINMRRENGCTCVEMEAAAFFAVARFRKVEIAQILYAGDDVSGEVWDSRNWDNLKEIRKKVLEIAVDSCSCL